MFIVSSCRRSGASGASGPAFLLSFFFQSSCHALHVGIYLFQKSSFSLSLSKSISFSYLDRRGTWERSDFVRWCSCLPAFRRYPRTKYYTTVEVMRRPWYITVAMMMALVCCFANDCCYVMDKRLAASATFRDCNGRGRGKECKDIYIWELKEKCRAQTWY